MIALSEVRFRWLPTDPLVIDIAEFTVADGERVFLEGPSGSGKSTLLNLLGGTATPEQGEIRIDGTSLADLGLGARDAFRADRIGFIFQMFNLIPYLSLVDNVILPCRFSTRREQAARDKSGSVEAEARRLLQNMEIDVDAMANRPVAGLSTGQQQRVAVARSLIGAPRLIIADEPTSALDENARRSFMNLLFKEVADASATLLFVSHDVGLAADFDRRMAMSEINGTGGA
jgi:putative ABC transport system ATP-binding protein